MTKKRIEVFTGDDLSLLVNLVSNIDPSRCSYDSPEILALIYRCKAITEAVENDVAVTIRLRNL